MAYTYATDPASVAIDNTGHVIAGRQLEVYTGRNGVKITALQTLSGAPIAELITDQDGRFPFRIAEEIWPVVWILGPGGVWWSVPAVELLAQVPQTVADTAAAVAAVATLTSRLEVLEAVEPPVEDYTVTGRYTVQAVGDGEADDTAAIQTALDAIGNHGGGTVVLPPGRYKITAPLQIWSGTTLEGAGVGNRLAGYETDPSLETPTSPTIIEQATPDTAGIVGAEMMIQHVHLVDFQLNGPGQKVGGGHGIDFDWDPVGTATGTVIPTGGRVNYVDVERVTIFGFGGDGIRLRTALVSMLQSVVVQRCGRDGFVIWDGATSTSVINCWALGCGGAGYRLGTPQADNGPIYTALTGCASDYNAGDGYVVERAQTITLTSCGSQANGGIPLRIAGSNTLSAMSFEVIANAGSAGIDISDGCWSIQLIGCADNDPRPESGAFVYVHGTSEVTMMGINYGAGHRPGWDNGARVWWHNTEGLVRAHDAAALAADTAGMAIIDGNLWLLSNANWDGYDFYRTDETLPAYAWVLGAVGGQTGTSLWIAAPQSYYLIRGGGLTTGPRFGAAGGWELLG